MKTLVNTKPFVNKLLCLVLSFTLAFSMMGTSAFASELASQIQDETPTIQTDAQPAAEQQLAPAAEDQNEPQEEQDGDQGLQDGTLVPQDEVDPLVGEDGQILSPENPDPEPDDVTPPSISVTASYDASQRSIRYVVHIANSGSSDISQLYVQPSFESTPDIGMGIFMFEGEQFEYSVPAGGSIDVAFSAEVPAYETAEAPQVTCTASVDYKYGTESRWYTTSGQAVTELPQAHSAELELVVKPFLLNSLGEPSDADYAYPGNSVEYVCTVTNNGADSVSNVQLVARKNCTLMQLVFDTSLEGLDASGFTLAPGASATFSAAYAVTDDDVRYGVVSASVEVSVQGRVVVSDPEVAAAKVGNGFEYFVSYYVNEGNGTGAQLIETLPLGIAELGQKIDLEEGSEKGQLDYWLPGKGYTAHASTLTVGSDAEKNVIKVTYSKNLYSYAVKYYKDAVDEQNLLWTDDDYGQAYFEQQVALSDETALNEHRPDGYAWLDLGSVDPLTISYVPEDNVINVVYAKGTFGYTINLHDAEGNLVGTKEGTALFGQDIPVVLEDADAPQGYDPSAYEVSGAATIGADPAANVVDVTYTTKNSYGYTINYYYDTSLKDAPDATYAGSAEYGSSVEIDKDLANTYRPAGYDEVDGFTIESISSNPAENVCTVVYTKTQNIPYVINFYKDSVSTENLVGTHPGTGTFQDILRLDNTQLNALKPLKGYQDLKGTREFVVTADPAKNVFNVVYKRDSFTYTIEYYQKEIVNDREVTKPLGAQVSNDKFLFGSVVTIDADQLNAYLPQSGSGPSGYVAKTADDQVELTITADEQANVVQVTYELKSFEYTVNYYKDSKDPENLIEGATIHDVSKYGAILPFFNTVLNAHLPEGYEALDGQRFLTITSDPAANVLDIVYSKKQENLPYRIEYYLDSLDGQLAGTYDGTGAYGERIEVVPSVFEGYKTTPSLVTGASYIQSTLDKSIMKVVYERDYFEYTVNYYKDSLEPDNFIDSVIDVDEYGANIPLHLFAHAPEGYNARLYEHHGATTVSANPANNVVNIVYTGEPRVAYTVEYYAGSVSGLPFAQASGAGLVGDEIPYDATIAAPLGYSAPPELSGATVIGEDPAANVLYVVFPAGSYGYTVNYYKDEISADTLLGTEEGIALYNTPIPYENGLYVPRGYDAAGQVTARANMDYDDANNVVSIVYHPARFSYTINYYRGSIDPANRIQSVTQEPRLYGSVVDITADELNYYMPEGYARLTEGTSLTISDVLANNVVNIVFTPDFTGFYSTSIEPLKVTYDGNVHRLAAPRGLYAGDIVTYSYDGGMQTRVVGQDADVSAVFTDVTDGEMLVSVTVKRAGVVSSALTTAVTIEPAAVEQPPAVVEDSSNGGSQGNIQDIIIDPIVDAIVTPVMEVFGAIATPSYHETAVGAALAGVLGGVTIDDDATPLSDMQSLQLQTQQGATTSNLIAVLSNMLLVLGALCALATILLIILRRRALDFRVVLKGQSLAVVRSRAQALAAICLGTALFGICCLILWCMLRI